MRTLALSAMTVLAALLLACSASNASPPETSPDGGSLPLPTWTPDDDAPPPLIAGIDGTGYELATGTYCWVRLCVDAIGIIAPPEPATAGGGDAVELHPARGAPVVSEASWRLFALPAGQAPVESGDDWTAWRPEAEPAASGTGLSLELDVPAGRYLLDVAVSYGEGESAMHGLLIDVR